MLKTMPVDRVDVASTTTKEDGAEVKVERNEAIERYRNDYADFMNLLNEGGHKRKKVKYSYCALCANCVNRSDVEDFPTAGISQASDIRDGIMDKMCKAKIDRTTGTYVNLSADIQRMVDDMCKSGHFAISKSGSVIMRYDFGEGRYRKFKTMSQFRDQILWEPGTCELFVNKDTVERKREYEHPNVEKLKDSLKKHAKLVRKMDVELAKKAYDMLGDCLHLEEVANFVGITRLTYRESDEEFETRIRKVSTPLVELYEKVAERIDPHVLLSMSTKEVPPHLRDMIADVDLAVEFHEAVTSNASLEELAEVVGLARKEYTEPLERFHYRVSRKFDKLVEDYTNYKRFKILEWIQNKALEYLEKDTVWENDNLSHWHISFAAEEMKEQLDNKYKGSFLPVQLSTLEDAVNYYYEKFPGVYQNKERDRAALKFLLDGYGSDMLMFVINAAVQFTEGEDKLLPKTPFDIANYEDEARRVYDEYKKLVAVVSPFIVESIMVNQRSRYIWKERKSNCKKVNGADKHPLAGKKVESVVLRDEGLVVQIAGSDDLFVCIDFANSVFPRTTKNVPGSMLSFFYGGRVSQAMEHKGKLYLVIEDHRFVRLTDKVEKPLVGSLVTRIRKYAEGVYIEVEGRTFLSIDRIPSKRLSKIAGSPVLQAEEGANKVMFIIVDEYVFREANPIDFDAGIEIPNLEKIDITETEGMFQIRVQLAKSQLCAECRVINESPCCAIEQEDGTFGPCEIYADKCRSYEIDRNFESDPCEHCPQAGTCADQILKGYGLPEASEVVDPREGERASLGKSFAPCEVYSQLVNWENNN